MRGGDGLPCPPAKSKSGVRPGKLSSGRGGTAPASLVQWFEPPHPWAFTNHMCDLALEHAKWRATPTHPRKARLGHVVPSEVTERMWGRMRWVAAQASLRGPRVEISPPQTLTVLHYRTGQLLMWHDDTYAESDREGVAGYVLSAIVQLSDPSDYKGGSVEFDAGGTIWTMPSTRGTVAVFPSTTRHRARTVTAGERRSMTVFFPGPDGLTETPL